MTVLVLLLLNSAWSPQNVFLCRDITIIHVLGTTGSKLNVIGLSQYH